MDRSTSQPVHPITGAVINECLAQQLRCFGFDKKYTFSDACIVGGSDDPKFKVTWMQKTDQKVISRTYNPLEFKFPNVLGTIWIKGARETYGTIDYLCATQRQWYLESCEKRGVKPKLKQGDLNLLSYSSRVSVGGTLFMNIDGVDTELANAYTSIVNVICDIQRNLLEKEAPGLTHSEREKADSRTRNPFIRTATNSSVALYLVVHAVLSDPLSKHLRQRKEDAAPEWAKEATAATTSMFDMVHEQPWLFKYLFGHIDPLGMMWDGSPDGTMFECRGCTNTGKVEPTERVGGKSLGRLIARDSLSSVPPIEFRQGHVVVKFVLYYVVQKHEGRNVRVLVSPSDMRTADGRPVPVLVRLESMKMRFFTQSTSEIRLGAEENIFHDAKVGVYYAHNDDGELCRCDLPSGLIYITRRVIGSLPSTSVDSVDELGNVYEPAPIGGGKYTDGHAMSCASPDCSAAADSPARSNASDDLSDCPDKVMSPPDASNDTVDDADDQSRHNPRAPKRARLG